MYKRSVSFNLHAAIGVIAVLILGFSSPGFAVDKLKIKLSWTPTAYQAPIHLANEKGWFRDQGLDVEVEDGRGSVLTISVVASGSADLGSASVSAMVIARDKRAAQAKAIMTIMRQSDIAVSVTKESGIKTIKDLEGRKVLYSSNGFEVPFLDMFFAAGGADRKKVKLISATGSKYGAYMAGEAEGVFGSFPVTLAIAGKKRPSIPIKFSEHGLALPVIGIIARDDTIKAKRDQLKRFVKVLSSSYEYTLNGNEDEAFAAVLKQRPNAKISVGFLKTSFAGYRPLFYSEATKGKPIGWQAPEDWADAVATMKKAGVIGKDAKPTDFYTNDLF